jgi:hypothetical protein
MAALFPAFLSAIGSSTAGAAATTAGVAATGTAGAFSSLASIASIGSTVVGGLASLAGGAQKQAALNAQAFDEEGKAVQETITGRQDALAAMQKLNQDLAKVTVAGFASGLQGDGSIAAAQDEAIRIGEANMNTARNNAAYMAAARRGQARQLRIEGKAARTEGIFGAIQGGLSLFSRRTARG